MSLARALAAFALLAALALGCDGGEAIDAGAGDAGSRDAGATSDAGHDAGHDAAIDAAIDAAVEADAGAPGPLHCGGDALVIAAVDPGQTVTIFNPTAGAIDLTGSEWVICDRPSYLPLDTIEPGVTIEAGASHAFAYPSSFVGTDAGGELALYRRSAFANPDALVDYVCWGTGSASESRRSVAEMGGDWSGACAGAITGEALTRRPDTDGRDASAYDPTGSSAALACP